MTSNPELMRGSPSEELDSPISDFEFLYASEYTSTGYGAPTAAIVPLSASEGKR